MKQSLQTIIPSRVLDILSNEYKYILPVNQSFLPRNIQSNGSSSCFLMSSISCRHQLQIIDPINYPPSNDFQIKQRLSNVDPFGHYFNYNANSDTYNGGIPSEAFKRIVSDVQSLPIDNDFMDIIKMKISKFPAVLPYLPPRHTSSVVDRISKGDFCDMMFQMLSKPMISRNWHSQCIVGHITINSILYFVARQTWNNCWLTLIPIVSNDEIISECKANGMLFTKSMLVDLHRHHQIYFPMITLAKGISNDALSFKAGPSMWLCSNKNAGVNKAI